MTFILTLTPEYTKLLHTVVDSQPPEPCTLGIVSDPPDTTLCAPIKESFIP